MGSRPTPIIPLGLSHVRQIRQTSRQTAHRGVDVHAAPKYIVALRNWDVSSEGMEQPSLLQFLKSAGLKGAGSVALSVASFIVTVKKHIDKDDIDAAVFFCVGCLAFCYGAYLAWRNEREQHLRLYELTRKPPTL